MRLYLTVAVCLLWAQNAHPQTPPDTFQAGYGEPIIGFYLGDDVDSGKVAIRLPAELAGRMVYLVRAYLRPPVEGGGGPVDDSLWLQKAAFTWGLATGNQEQPLTPTLDAKPVDLKSVSELKAGGWSETPVEWPILAGETYWLVGYWQRGADFIRLAQCQRDPSCGISIWPDQGRNEQWGGWFSSGLVVEVGHGIPGQGIPSGVLDLSDNLARTPTETPHAAITGGALAISFPRYDWPQQSYSLQVVNTLGQTVVSQSGIADAGVMRIPWSAGRPSGVYFCRIRLGNADYAVPVVNLK